MPADGLYIEKKSSGVGLDFFDLNLIDKLACLLRNVAQSIER